MRAALLLVFACVGCKRDNDIPPLPVAAPAASAAAGPEVDDSATGPAAFLAWAAEARAKPQAYGPTEECYGPDSPRRGICARTHFPDRFTSWDIDYVKRAPRGFKIHAHFASTLTCASIGANPVRAWRYASLSKSLCKFLRGPLTDLYVQLETPADGDRAETNVFLFSAEYLDAAPSFRAVVMSQGR